MNINKLALEIHQNAIAHGWWEEERKFPEIAALIHSEISEALEEYRNGHETEEIYYSCRCAKNGHCPSQHDIATICKGQKPKPEGIAAELADVIIRVLDFTASEGIDIEAVIMAKHEYNKSRPYRHGGKKI